jgi:outer membrane protein OmpA-like peptidoglycan-associated protein
MRNKLIFFSIFLFANLLTINAQSRIDTLYSNTVDKFSSYQKSNVSILLPNNYSDAREHFTEAVELMNDKEDSSKAIEDFNYCIQLLDNISFPLSVRKKVFDNILKLRKQALKLDADILSSSAWEMSEEKFIEAVDLYNNGKPEESFSCFPALEQNYKHTISYAQKARELIYDWQPLKDAYEECAEITAPDEFNEGMELLDKSLEEINDAESKDEVDTTISHSANSFSRATTKAKDFEKVFPLFIKRRKTALKSGAGIYAPNHLTKGESLLTETVDDFDETNRGELENKVKKGKYEYYFAWRISRREILKNDAFVYINKCKEINAEKYAPVNYGKGTDNFESALKYGIDSLDSVERSIEYLKKSINYSKRTIAITNIILDVKNNKTTWEDEILLHNGISRTGYNRIFYKDISISNALEVAQNAFQKLNDINGRILSPLSFRRSSNLLNQASNLFPYSDETINLAKRSERFSRVGVKISKIVRKIYFGEATPESIIDKWDLNPEKIILPPSELNVNSDTELLDKVNKDITKVAKKDSIKFSLDEALVFNKKKNVVLRLVGLKYKSGYSRPTWKGRKLLNKVVKYLEPLPIKNIEIRCYTDAIGSKRTNKRISAKRAKYIKDYILKKSKLSSDIIQAIGMGEANPIASNRTWRGRQINRRVEITVIEK